MGRKFIEQQEVVPTICGHWMELKNEEVGEER